jgi:hypothetical protein
VVGGYISTVTYPGKSKEPNSVFFSFQRTCWFGSLYCFTWCKTFEEA